MLLTGHRLYQIPVGGIRQVSHNLHRTVVSSIELLRTLAEQNPNLTAREVAVVDLVQCYPGQWMGKIELYCSSCQCIWLPSGSCQLVLHQPHCSPCFLSEAAHPPMAVGCHRASCLVALFSSLEMPCTWSCNSLGSDQWRTSDCVWLHTHGKCPACPEGLREKEQSANYHHCSQKFPCTCP
jgi:hypothetical protein